MTMTENEAYQALLAHHDGLSDGVVRHATALRQAVRAGDGWAPAAAALVVYLAEEVLPHADAEEKSIYQAARAYPELDQPVVNMIDEHRVLADATEQLATTGSAGEAETLAATISSLFTTHVQKENEVILPLLSAGRTVDLPALVAEMHSLTEVEKRESGPDGAARADLVAALTSLLLDAASGLADAGHGDRACRLTAEAWALLRKPRPQLAVRVTAKLHHLARSVTAEPVTFTSRSRASGVPGGGDAELDVRPLAPAQRHEKIFATYGALAPGSSFVLVNDHDPKPLRYQFEAEHAGEFTWDTLEAGPAVWRVRISRPADPAPEGAEEPELDVRRFPHGQRHDVIFTSYQSLARGGGFVLVNDHDPKPLRYQFEAQYPGEYTWDYQEAGPDLWRVRIGRPATA